MSTIFGIGSENRFSSATEINAITGIDSAIVMLFFRSFYTSIYSRVRMALAKNAGYLYTQYVL